MKLMFNTLKTQTDTIKVSFDNGVSYKEYNVSDITSNGISFTKDDCPDLSKIKIKGKFETFDSIDVVKTAALEEADQSIKFTKLYCFKWAGGYSGSDTVYYKSITPNTNNEIIEDCTFKYIFSGDTTCYRSDGTPTDYTAYGYNGLSSDDYDMAMYWGRNKVEYFNRYEDDDICEVITKVDNVQEVTVPGSYICDDGTAIKGVNVNITLYEWQNVFDSNSYIYTLVPNTDAENINDATAIYYFTEDGNLTSTCPARNESLWPRCYCNLSSISPDADDDGTILFALSPINGKAIIWVGDEVDATKLETTNDDGTTTYDKYFTTSDEHYLYTWEVTDEVTLGSFRSTGNTISLVSQLEVDR